MKYAIVTSEGTIELREDDYALSDNAIKLTDEEYNQLISSKYILQDGKIIDNPNVRSI
jgi:hypothetical protein